MERSRKAGIDRINNYRDRAEPSRPLIKFIPFEVFELEGLLDEIDECIEIEKAPECELVHEFSVTEKQFCSMLQPSAGQDLTRVRGLLDGLQKRDKDDQEETEANSTGPEPPTDNRKGNEETSNFDYRKYVYGQLSDLTPYRQLEDSDNPLEGDNKSLLSKVNAGLQDFQLEAGPADITRIHDFQSLQIAFKDVWSETFDPSLRDKIEKFYHAYVEVRQEHERLGQEKSTPSVEFNDLFDIKAFLEDVDREDRWLMQPVPPAVVEIWGDFALEKDWNLYERWNLLSPAEQQFLLQLIGPQQSATREKKVSLEPQTPLRTINIEESFFEDHPEKEHAINILKDEWGFVDDGQGNLKGRFPATVDLDMVWNAPFDIRGMGIIQHLLTRYGYSYKERAGGLGVYTSRGAVDSNPTTTEVRSPNLVPQGMDQEERKKAGISILANPSGARTRLYRLKQELNEQLTEPYAFQYFEPNSVNYGLVTTYRQEWEPQTYQVGDLVSTIPLAPSETRKYTKNTVVKKTRSEKEVENSLVSRRGESTKTGREDTEIVKKATRNSNFKMTADGSYGGDLAAFKINASTEFGLDQANESASTKKAFREAVVKAAHEYKNERSLEVSTTDEFTEESTSSGEITNPNNELTVTYLLYELERQYKISERIHQLTPVILVAQEIPEPDDITEAWLLEHEWILRRVLLDDSFLPALDHLSGQYTGDEYSIEVKRKNWKTQRDLVQELQETVDRHRAVRDQWRQYLTAKAEERDIAKAAGEEWWGFVPELLLGLIADPRADTEKYVEAKRAAIETELGYLQETLDDAQERLVRGRDSFDKATNAYTEALESRTNARTAIDQLRVHIKNNILYYMQAIWEHESPDQRYFRLYDKEVFVPETQDITVRLRTATQEEVLRYNLGLDKTRELQRHNGTYYVVETTEISAVDHTKTRRLVEVADLDSPLGYKGNYIIFPLKTCTFVTDYMMREYVDDYFGIRDPDEYSEFTAEELLQYMKELQRKAEEEGNPLTEEETDALIDIITKRLSSPRRESDLVVVPTGELYMEALMGAHPLLEQFKLNHRGYDMAKARAELREVEIENLRRAARLLGEEPELDDPDVDRYVVVDGIEAEAEIGTDDETPSGPTP